MKQGDSKSSKGVEALARFGYAAKGVVYLLVGALAFMAAFGLGGQTTGTKGAINQLASQSYGRIMIILMALGLAGYVVWRFTQCFADPEHKGSDFKGIAMRIGLLISGLIYGGLAVYTISILFTAGSSGNSGDSAQDRTATLMSHNGGIWLVAAIGIGIIGVGLYQAWRGYSKSFKKNWDTASMKHTQERWATHVARFGLFARALVFLMIGSFLVTAAWQSDPSEAKGLGGALSTLATQPYGPWLLGLVAAGLVCYGGYCFVNARYRHIDPE